MKISIIIILFSPLFLTAQKEHGIAFIEGSNWEEVLQEAKAENKYIFVDCFASWCQPCKWMDQNVYSLDTVNEVMKDKFLFVKIQMDSTRQDSNDIRARYKSVNQFSKLYHITQYPSYLFFSPEGRLLHEDLGTKNVKNFLTLIKAAMDPQQQYFTLLAQYQQGKKDYSVMPYLSSMAKHLGNDSLYTIVVEDYMCNFLDRLPIQQLWTKDNLKYIESNWECLHSTDKLFRLYYQDRKKIDSIMEWEWYSDLFINNVIYNEEVAPTIERKTKTNEKREPGWNKMKNAIKTKYNKYYAEKNVLNGQIKYYKSRKKWSKYVTCFIKWQEENSMRKIHQVNATIAANYLNSCAWEVFKYSADKNELEKGLSWVDTALMMTSKPSFEAMDTKANILYKLGMKDQALALEAQSFDLATDNKDSIRENFEKMKNGMPTWPVE